MEERASESKSMRDRTPPIVVATFLAGFLAGTAWDGIYVAHPQGAVGEYYRFNRITGAYLLLTSVDIRGQPHRRNDACPGRP